MPWELIGNNVAQNANPWLGTTTAKPLMIRTNDNGQPIGAQPPLDPQEAMRITPFQSSPFTQRGRVGIWTDAPARALHVEDQIHTGGDEAGLSFGNRRDLATGQPSPFTDVPFNGERWVWRASEGTAHLWSNTNKISVTAAGRVGIGTAAPNRTLDVQGSEVHSGGNGAGFSFGNRETLDPFSVSVPDKGERWVWYASDGMARLWSFKDKLIVTPIGQILSRGGEGAGEALFPQVPIGAYTPPQFIVPPPLSPAEPGELVLDGNRTSIRGFDGPREDPARPLGLSLRLGTHVLRTNGQDLENWIGFERRQWIPKFIGGDLDRRMNAYVAWFGPAFNGSSDARLKTNVRQVEGALEKLERIRGTAFEWAETESPYALGGLPGRAGIGVVAQEVEEVFPEVVSTYDVASAEPDQDDTDQEDKEEYKAVDYNGLTSVLIEAVKELKAQNDELRSRIEALEGAQE